MSNYQFAAVLAGIPATLGMAHLAMYLRFGIPAEGWASLTCLFLSVPGWVKLFRTKNK